MQKYWNELFSNKQWKTKVPAKNLLSVEFLSEQSFTVSYLLNMNYREAKILHSFKKDFNILLFC